MNAFRLGAIAAVTLFSSSSFAQYADVGTFVERGMELWHTPGAAAAVVTDEAILFRQGFGSTSIDNGRNVDEHTGFAIASTTKAMVAMGVLMLVDDGKLSLDDPVTRHIPELHFADGFMDQEITVRDLLAHRTGLPSTDSWSFFLDMPIEEQIRRLRYVERAAGIRTSSIYQNTMYDLMGVLIRNLDGREWADYLAEELWQPLGMHETYAARGDMPGDQSFVQPHFFRDDKLVRTPFDLPEDDRMPAGSVWSTIHDMSLWAQFLLRGGTTADGERLVSAAQYAQMFEPTQLAAAADFYPTVELTQPHWRTYGLGWFQQDFQGRMIDFHTGSLGGLVAIIGLDRDAKRAVVMLANRDHAEFRHALLWHVMDNSSGDDRRDWNADIFDLYERNAAAAAAEQQDFHALRREGTTTSVPLEEFAGTYSNDAFGELVFAVDDDDLVANTALREVRFSHWHDNVFLWKFEDWDFEMLVEFRVGFDNKVVALEWGDDLFTKTDREAAD
ncbi:MAG: serine hydrolase [Gammaproteobacteria bacterium]|nr:serine hydrolase [Gammaproteobacteria bacterium]